MTTEKIAALMGFVFLFLTAGPGASAEPGRVLFTADVEAHLQACSSCPSRAGRGGLARASGVIKKERERAGNTLLLDAGNFLSGGKLPVDDVPLMIRAYEKMGYDAVNVSYQDFVPGASKVRKQLQKESITPISANLLDQDSEKPLFKTHVTRTINGTTYVITGVTETPPRFSVSEHWSKTLQGLTVRDPVPSVRDVLGSVEVNADRVFVLYHGSTRTLAKLRNELGSNVDLFLAGGTLHSEDVLGAGTPPVVTAPRHGTGVTRVSLPGSGSPFQADEMNTLPVLPSMRRDESVADVVDPPIQAALDEMEAARRQKYERALPENPETGRRFVLYRSGSNRGLRVTLSELRFLDAFGGLEAPEGSRLLVLDSAWENKIEAEALEAGLPTHVGVQGLTKRVFLTIDGNRLARLHPKTADVPEALPGGFVLKNPGARGEGKLVFVVPDRALQSMTLHLFHDRWGPLRVPIKRGESTASATPRGSNDLRWTKNSVAKIAVAGHETRETVHGRKAPPEMEFLVARLTGTSRLTVDTEAVAVRKGLSSKEEMKKMVPIGKPLPHAYATGMIQAVVDGERTFLPFWEAGTFPDVPVFFPDRPITGEVVFLVPKDRSSLSIRVLFPTLKLPGRRGGQKKLTGLKHLRLDLEGTFSTPESRKALGVLKDRPIAAGVMDARLTGKYMGETPGAGRQFVILTVTLKHSGEGKGGMYTFDGRLFLTPSGGSKQKPHELSFREGSPPGETFYVPSGIRQAFDLVFEVPEGTKSGTITYQGIKKFSKLNISFK